MKYSIEHCEEMEDYAVGLGVDNRIADRSRTILQADRLKQIQFECKDIHLPFYWDLKAEDLHDPGREQRKAQKAIGILLENLQSYHMPSELEMIAQLQALQERLDMDNRVLKPKQYLDGVLENITEELLEVGFSDTEITDNLLPFFTAMIKGDLHY